MKRTIKSFLAAAGLAIIGLGSMLLASPASADTYFCDDQGKTGTIYPLDGIDGPGPLLSHAFRCKNLTTGVLPSDSRTIDLFSSLASTTMPNNVKNQLKNRNVRYFLFNNRTEANDYFQQTAPYKLSSTQIIVPFVSTSSRCAQTGYGLDTSVTPTQRIIVVAIYDNCRYDSIGLTVQNPSLRRTGFHETGHAFDFALAPSGSNSPSSRAGFTSLFTRDKNLVTPTNWASMNDVQKSAYMCNLFSFTIPSALEKDLGATSNGGPGGQVCQTNGVRYPYYELKTPTETAAEKLPYFTTAPGANQDIWAEAFVVLIDSSTSPASFLPVTDRVIGAFQSPIRSYNCVRGVVKAYVDTLAAPTTTVLQNLGCPTAPGPL